MAERARVFPLASSDPTWMDEAACVMFPDAMPTSEKAPRRRPMSLGAPALLVQPSWTPDGERVGFVRENDLYSTLMRFVLENL